MKNIARSFLLNSSHRIRLFILVCLTASTVITVAIAKAEPRSASDSGVPMSAASTASAESALTSPTAAVGGTCIKGNRDDGLCPWGWLGDGHGMLVRCLTSDEARSLAKSANGEIRPGGTAAMVPSEERSAIEAIVNSVVFEGEHIASAKPNLASLAPDYQSCVARHGGLRHDTGELRLRFHVDLRGVARDASVSRRRVVSIQAAHCIAGIINLRFVGVPKSKASIGTLIIQFTRNAG